MSTNFNADKPCECENRKENDMRVGSFMSLFMTECAEKCFDNGERKTANCFLSLQAPSTIELLKQVEPKLKFMDRNKLINQQTISIQLCNKNLIEIRFNRFDDDEVWND